MHENKTIQSSSDVHVYLYRRWVEVRSPSPAIRIGADMNDPSSLLGRCIRASVVLQLPLVPPLFPQQHFGALQLADRRLLARTRVVAVHDE